MAPCMDPSLPKPLSDLSALEKQRIYLTQQQKNFSPFLAFKPIDEERNIANIGQVYKPINSLVNGFPDFSMATSSTSLAMSDSDTVKEINIKKRKCQRNENSKAEQSNAIEGEGGGSSKKVKQDSSNGNHGRNIESIKERNRKGKNKKNITIESSKDNKNDSEASTVDYIHVRARRGQATDSHSLAERVRRERISERMRYLQELVPGCNKVTGKAGMLDEIINYVQSLQRQVEFLSMKLAAVNPTVDIDIDDLLNRQMIPGCLPMINVLNNNQLDPSLLQLNPLQQLAACYGLEIPMENLNPTINGSIPEQISVPDTLGDPYLNLGYWVAKSLLLGPEPSENSQFPVLKVKGYFSLKCHLRPRMAD